MKVVNIYRDTSTHTRGYGGARDGDLSVVTDGATFSLNEEYSRGISAVERLIKGTHFLRGWLDTPRPNSFSLLPNIPQVSSTLKTEK